MNRIHTLAAAAALSAAALAPSGPAYAQDFPTDDPVLRAIWQAGMVESRAGDLAQVLLDSLGPRLTGTPDSEAAADWVARMYRSWGMEARLEPYGTWIGWRRGITHVDLLEPRVRSLDAMMLAWSPGTGEEPVTGEVIALPRIAAPAELPALLERARGKFVLLASPEPTCRPEENWEEWATEESLERMRAQRDSARADFAQRVAATGLRLAQLARALEDAGAAGFFATEWPDGWGVRRVFNAATVATPHVSLSCEDYGLLWRLAEEEQGPVVRVEAEAELLGEVPVANLIGVIPGAELPDEYVMLSAHFDSWDGASGATDNGTGTITMMEAMRILSAVHPRPKRTILVGHWNGEEQGLNGSGAFAADHPEVLEGLQVLLNQDNGTGRITTISMMGLVEAGEFFGKWLSRIPQEITQHIDVTAPGSPSGGGSDYASFVCRGAPAVALSAHPWDYSTYTWHSTLDTFDKVVLDDLKNNATLTAMIAYLASEDPELIPRTRRVMPTDRRTGRPAAWPACRQPLRSSGR